MASESSSGAAPAPLERHQAAVEEFARQIVKLGGFRLDVKVRHLQPADEHSPAMVVDFSGPDAGLLLEAHGELLNAIEYVVLRAVRLEESLFPKISFDCEDYRRMRVEELKLMAQVAADRVRDTGMPFPLGPMNARERRIIHLALNSRPEVRTESEGQGPERKVVIHSAAKPARR
ncbi:MAG TPA: R3H domain-containing nucleic acid-binding protein [Terriglobia bacterium]|nr:R3H domain-containing nucleic acid-binding protein [Terriglobia bacterium]